MELRTNKRGGTEVHRLALRHFCHLLWAIYSFQVGELPFGLCNAALILCSLVLATVLVSASGKFPGLGVSYALLTPILSLVTWKAVSPTLTAIAASGLLQLYVTKPAVAHIHTSVTGSDRHHFDLVTLSLDVFRCGLSTLCGRISQTDVITWSFGLPFAACSLDLAMCLSLYGRKPQ